VLSSFCPANCTQKGGGKSRRGEEKRKMKKRREKRREGRNETQGSREREE
jgi:hypothetical protein